MKAATRSWPSANMPALCLSVEAFARGESTSPRLSSDDLRELPERFGAARSAPVMGSLARGKRCEGSSLTTHLAMPRRRPPRRDSEWRTVCRFGEPAPHNSQRLRADVAHWSEVSGQKHSFEALRSHPRRKGTHTDDIVCRDGSPAAPTALTHVTSIRRGPKEAIPLAVRGETKRNRSLRAVDSSRLDRRENLARLMVCRREVWPFRQDGIAVPLGNEHVIHSLFSSLDEPPPQYLSAGDP